MFGFTLRIEESGNDALICIYFFKTLIKLMMPFFQRLLGLSSPVHLGQAATSAVDEPVAELKSNVND